MPNGRTVTGLLTVTSLGSTNLTGATLSTPEATSAAILQPVPGRSTKGAFVNPVTAGISKIARDAPLHDYQWFEKIHVVPRELDLGPVVSEQELQVEVWNAFRQRAKSLTSITVTGSDGISTVPTGALHFPATFSKLYTVLVAGSGDPIIDALVTWIFTGIDPLGTNLHIVGFRMVPFAWPPGGQGGGAGGEGAAGVVERFGYLTDILVSYRGMEQRRQLRLVPVGSISYSVVLAELQEVQMANAILYGNQSRPFGIPRWQFRTELTVQASAGGSVLTCDTTNLPFEDGGLCFLWKSPTLWEAHTVLSHTTSSITLALPLRKTWPIGTAVIPMVSGRLPVGPAFVWETLNVGSQEISFDVDGFRP